MKQYILLTLFIMLFYVGKTWAITEHTGPWEVDCAKFDSFASCAWSPETAKKTIVLTTKFPVNDNQSIPYDRAVEIKKGGGFVFSNKATLTINSPFSSGDYQIFSGPGTVVGLSMAKPEWWGATPGINFSNSVRTKNTDALNQAFMSIAGSGTLRLSNTFEVNDSLLWGTKSYADGKTSVVGNNDENSKIISYAAKTVIDAVGRQYLKISGLNIHGNAAETGFLMARANNSIAGGYELSLDHVKITGNFSKSAIVTIASELLHANKCYFANSYPNGKIYASSTNNTTIGASSAYGPLSDSSNTDIHFTDTSFYAFSTGQDVVWLENSFDGVFKDCLFITHPPSSGVKLVHFVSNVGNRFNGRVVFDGNMLEGPMTALYFDYIGSNGSFYDLIFKNNTMNLFAAGNRLFDYKSIANSYLYNFVWDNNKVSPVVLGGDNTLALPTTINASINNLGYKGKFDYSLYSSKLRLDSVTWGSGAYAAASSVEASNVLNLGISPVITGGLTPPNHTAKEMMRLVLGPVTGLIATPQSGEIQTVDSGYGAGFPGATSGPGLIQMGWFDGTNWRPVGVFAGTPAHSNSPCYPGTVLYDGSYIYVCVASNTWRRTAWESRTW